MGIVLVRFFRQLTQIEDDLWGERARAVGGVPYVRHDSPGKRRRFLSWLHRQSS